MLSAQLSWRRLGRRCGQMTGVALAVALGCTALDRARARGPGPSVVACDATGELLVQVAVVDRGDRRASPRRASFDLVVPADGDAELVARVGQADQRRHYRVRVRRRDRGRLELDLRRAVDRDFARLDLRVDALRAVGGEPAVFARVGEPDGAHTEVTARVL